MKTAIILDNNVSKAHTRPFELIAGKDPDMSFTAFIGEKNKADASRILLPKVFLSHGREAMAGLAAPVEAARRLRENRFPRMDYYYFTLARELKGFDAVYTQDVTRSLYTVASLKQRCGYRIALRWWENLPYKRLFSEKDSCIATASLDKVDLFLPATRMAEEALLLEGVGRDRMTQVYPGIDTEMFSPAGQAHGARERYGIPAGKTAVLFAGRLVSHKGIFTILSAAARLRQAALLDGLAFVITGSGGQGQQMEKMAREMGLRDSFIFTGAVPYSGMPEVYRSCDMFILPSTMKEAIQEQFGLALAEAMSSGVAVIGSHAGAIPEVIGDSGIVVTAGDYRSLADAIKRLGENPGLRKELGEKARKRALALFSAERNSVLLLKALKGLAGR